MIVLRLEIDAVAGFLFISVIFLILPVTVLSNQNQPFDFISTEIKKKTYPYTLAQ